MKDEPTVIEYNGVKFRRYPHAATRSDRVYFTPGIADRQRGKKRLHEEIWMDNNGPIPADHHIHHRDGNPLNNDAGNLECLPVLEHHRHHHVGQCSDRKRRHLEEIRPLAAAWHSSPAGIEWHRQHAYKSIRAVEPTEHVCERCGKTFETIPKKTNRFCSNACKAAARRASGVDDIEFTCQVCGEAFTANRYSKRKVCSRSCAATLRKLKTSAP